MTTQIIVGSICIIIAVVILLGKGDWLIAGYNTASEEEKEKYNIKRLRLLIGILLLLVAPTLFLLSDNSNKLLHYIFTGIVLALTIIVVILANTWAKKK